VSAEELAKLRFWTSFELKYAAAVELLGQTLPASLEAFHQTIRELEAQAAAELAPPQSKGRARARCIDALTFTPA